MGKTRGFVEVSSAPIPHEGVEYRPMELAAKRVAMLTERKKGK
jgi:hypothetical protein